MYYIWVLMFLLCVRQREFPLKTSITFCQTTMIWLQGGSTFGSVPVYCGEGSANPRGNSEKAKGCRQQTQRGWTHISSDGAQSTVSLTCWLLMAKTRVCHWLSASRVPRNTECSTKPPRPFKRKCRRFLENLSPRRIRPGSSLLFICFIFFSASCSSPLIPLLVISETSPLFPSSSSSSTDPLFFGSTKEKMYSFLCMKQKEKDGNSHYSSRFIE